MVRISPLIATFIFVGISVGIGVLILNLTYVSKNTDCEDIDFELKRNFCNRQGSLQFTVKNRDILIAGFKLYMISETYDLYEDEVRGVEKELGYTVELNAEYYIELIPQLGDNEELCTSKKIFIENLEKC